MKGINTLVKKAQRNWVGSSTTYRHGKKTVVRKTKAGLLQMLNLKASNLYISNSTAEKFTLLVEFCYSNPGSLRQEERKLHK